MKDECISNSSTQQPSAIQSSSPTPTQRPSPLSSSPSSHVPRVQSNDDDTSNVTREGPTADASIFPTDDVSERNKLCYDLRFWFHPQFLLISISFLLTNRLCPYQANLHHLHCHMYQLHYLQKDVTGLKSGSYLIAFHMKHLGSCTELLVIVMLMVHKLGLLSEATL